MESSYRKRKGNRMTTTTRKRMGRPPLTQAELDSRREIARKLRALREQLGITQEQASEQSRLPYGTYLQAERGVMGRTTIGRALAWLELNKTMEGT